jgi:hypothetical protein
VSRSAAILDVLAEAARPVGSGRDYIHAEFTTPCSGSSTT